MTAPLPEMSLRLTRREWTRLGWVLAISIAVHLLAWGGYEAGKAFDLWNRLQLPAWARTITQMLAVVKLPPEKAADREPPLMFVDVNPAQASAEAPKNAAYYSALNSQAANPDADKDTGIPKIEGNQSQVLRTVDAERNKPQQLQPSPQEPAEASKPKPAMTIGDLALAKPDPNPRDTQGQAEESRPRTLVEAKMRQQMSSLAGERIKQEGGVRRRSRIASLDAMATQFGAYDQALIGAIQQRWNDLLDERRTGFSPGRVVVQFELKFDGTVSDVKVLETSVDQIMTYLCQKAIQDPSPYERWPTDMRRLNNGDTRLLKFAFYYN